MPKNDDQTRLEIKLHGVDKCTKPVDVPLSLQVLDIYANTRPELKNLQNEADKEKQKAEIMRAVTDFGKTIREKMEEKVKALSGYSVVEIDAMSTSTDPAEIKKFKKLMEGLPEKLSQDSEFNALLARGVLGIPMVPEQLYSEIGTWFEGAFSLDKNIGALLVGGILFGGAAVGKTVSLPFNAWEKGGKQAIKDWGSGVIGGWKLALIGAACVYTPLVRGATFAAGKLLELNNEISFFAIHPWDEGKNISRKMNFDKGADDMLGTLENRLDYFSVKDPEARKLRDPDANTFGDILDKAVKIQSGASFFPDGRIHALRQAEAKKAKDEGFSPAELEFIAKHIWKSRNSFEVSEWEKFQDQLHRKVADKATLQRFVFADTVGSLGLWLETNPAYRADFLKAKEKVMADMVENPEKLKESYDNEKIQSFFKGAKETIPENVRLTEKKGIERFLKLGFSGGYAWILIFSTLFANQFRLVQGGLVKGWEKIKGLKKAPKENKNKLPIPKKSKEILQDFIKNPTAKGKTKFIEILEKEEIVTFPPLFDVLKKYPPEDLAFSLKKTFDGNTGSSREEMYKALMNDLENNPPDKMDDALLGELTDLLDSTGKKGPASRYCEIKYKYDTFLVGMGRKKKGEHAAKLNYQFDFVDVKEGKKLLGSSVEDAHAKVLKVSDIEKLKSETGRFSGEVKIGAQPVDKKDYELVWGELEGKEKKLYLQEVGATDKRAQVTSMREVQSEPGGH